MNDVPNSNSFGSAKWPNITDFGGLRGSRGGGGGSNLANCPEVIYVYGLFPPPPTVVRDPDQAEVKLR